MANKKLVAYLRALLLVVPFSENMGLKSLPQLSLVLTHRTLRNDRHVSDCLTLLGRKGAPDLQWGPNNFYVEMGGGAKFYDTSVG